MIRDWAGVIEKNLFPVVGGARAADLSPTNENTVGRIAALEGREGLYGGYTNLNTRMKSSSLFSSSAFFSTPRSLGGNHWGLD